MAELSHHVEFSEVTSADILENRRAGWEAFTRSATWGIGAIALSLVLLYVIWG